jgi:hypothetical protein
MLAAATWSVGHSGITDATTGLVAAVTFAVLFRFPISPLWPLLGGGALELIVSRCRL